MARGIQCSTDIREAIIRFHRQGHNMKYIIKRIKCTWGKSIDRKTVRLWITRFKSGAGILSMRRKSTNIKLHPIHKQFINLWMRQDPELTSYGLCRKSKEVFNLEVSTRLMRRVRSELGWTARRVKYCQLISHKNKLERLEWCLSALARKDAFEDVIFVDETTVEMSSDGRLFFFQPSSRLQHIPARKPKPKHAYKVHVWAGISYRGGTNICIFTGIMNSIIYQKILEDNFLPFVNEVFPDGYRLYQDNDTKHRSKSTMKWFEEKGMTQRIMKTPASSPDINPIENVWSTLKNYLQVIVKPKKRDELVHGISNFWIKLTAEECGRYIDHIHKVIPYVILNDGGPSGF